MQQPNLLPGRSRQSREVAISWPDFPSVTATLLSAVGAAGILTGLAALTAQPWLSWLALVVAGAILGTHHSRRKRVERARRETREILGARLVSRCHQVDGPSPLQSYLDRSDGVVLALTDDAVLICQADRKLQVIATIPLFAVQQVSVAGLHQLLASDAALTLSVERHGIDHEQFTFGAFEVGVTLSDWLRDLQTVLPRAV